MKRICTILTFVLLAFIGMSAQSLSRVTVDGKEYYVYEVRKGDTMFGISRQFGWNQQTLRRYNPGQFTTLRKGTPVYYPCDAEDNTSDATAPDSSETQHNQVRHTIQRGETLYSISRMYGLSVPELQRLNPGAGDNIKAGDVLVISGSGENNDGAVTYHTIQKGETLYGLAKAGKVSVAAILSANPGISESKFKAGETIRIPAEGTGVSVETRMVTENLMNGFKPYKVKKNETWESIAKDNGIPVETLLEANKGIELKKNVYIGIPVITQRTVEREFLAEDNRDIDEIYADVHDIQQGGENPEVRIAVVSVEPNTRRDREILRGVLMAVNKLKNSGTKINLKMLDGTMKSESLVTDLNVFDPTVILSTAESQTPIWISRYAADNKVPVINALDVRNEAYQTNPFIVQLITPSDYFNDEIAAWFYDRYKGYSLVFTGEDDVNDQLAESLKKVWNPDMVRTRAVEDLKTMPLNNNGKYLLYGYPTRRQDVVEFLDAVAVASEKSPLAHVSVVGRPNWIVYDEALGDKFHKSDVQIPARFYMNKKVRQNSDFALQYRQLFDGDVPNTFPVYSAIGFDAALYFIDNLGRNGGDMNSLSESRGTVQNDYSLERPSTWSGPVNREVYVIHFTPYDSIEKNVVK